MSEENNTFENEEQQVNDYYTGEPEESGKGEATGLGIASMVCGIIAIPIMCCTNVGSVLSIILGIVAVVLGIMQIVKNEKKGMAIAGIVCGAIAIVLCISLLALGTYMLSSGAFDEIMKEAGITY